MPKTIRTGRPNANSDTILNAYLGARFTHSERDRVKKNAEKMGVTLSEYFRSVALQTPVRPPPPPPINLEAYGNLGRLASNINQLLKIANSGGQPVGVMNEIRELHGLLQSVRLDLMNTGRGES
jgi:hypothetical protein